jgi:hypothetical protein
VHFTVRPVQSLSACTTVHFTFFFLLLYATFKLLIHSVSPPPPLLKNEIELLRGVSLFMFALLLQKHDAPAIFRIWKTNNTTVPSS